MASAIERRRRRRSPFQRCVPHVGRARFRPRRGAV